MQVTRRISCETVGNNDLIDVTPQVAAAVASAGVRDGLATVFVAGSTAGVTTIENEPGLVSDFKEFLEQLAPEDPAYLHNLTAGDANAHSHLRASLIGPSLTVPIENGQLTLGVWQQIVLIDFDVRARHRELVVQLAGE